MEYSFNIGEQLIDYFKNWLKSDDGQDVIRQAVKEYPDADINGVRKEFLAEIEKVCKAYNISISHEDCHGAFVLRPYNDEDMDWLKHAYED